MAQIPSGRAEMVPLHLHPYEETNYNQKENVLFHDDCWKSLSLIFFFLCADDLIIFSSCSSGLKQLLKLCTQCGKNYDHIRFSNSDVMVESENNNEFPALCQKYDEGRKITCLIPSTFRFNASPLRELLSFIFYLMMLCWTFPIVWKETETRQP